MLRIYKSPAAFAFGLEDRFSAEMQRCLTRSGVPCVVKDLWSNLLARHLFFSKVPRGYKVYRRWVAPFYCWRHLREVQPDDVVWINWTSLPVLDTACRFERQVLQKGASYLFWLEDDWFSDPELKASADARMGLAHAVVAVTPSLGERIAGLYPRARVLVLEEPIDVERLAPVAKAEDGARPVVLCGGRPWALGKLPVLNGVLERVYKDIPFTLRVVSGRARPQISFSIPWEWLPYDASTEAAYAAGAVAGLAPLPNTVFNTCKGNYKVKTYMAMGVPPLTSPIGYNHRLVKHGQTGFLLDTENEWEATLRALLTDSSMAAKVGRAAREDTVARYSYAALMPVWAEALQKAFPGRFA